MIRVVMFLILTLSSISFAQYIESKCTAAKIMYGVVDACTIKVDGYDAEDCVKRSVLVHSEYTKQLGAISPAFSTAFTMVWKFERLEEVCIKMCYGVATKQITRKQVLDKVKNDMVNKYCR